MARYKKKPVVIEAIQLQRTRESINECLEFIGVRTDPPVPARCYKEGIYIPTLEGKMLASFGDYIIKGVKGECYPCKPDIFADTYEPVEDGQ